MASEDLPTTHVIEHQGRSKGFPFLKLPLELRNDIYRYLLSTRCIRSELFFNDKHTVPNRFYHFEMNICLTNHRIYEEAMCIFRTNLFIFVASGYPFNLQFNKLPSFLTVAEGHPLQKFCVMTVDLAHLATCQTGCIIAYEFLQKFCLQLLTYNNIRHHGFLQSISLSIDLHIESVLFDDAQSVSASSYRKRLKQLLEPFRCLHSVRWVRIDGQKEYGAECETTTSKQGDSYKSDIIASIVKEQPKFEDTTQAFISNRNQGHQAFKDCHYSRAASKYHKAYLIACEFDYLTDTEVSVTSGELAGMARQGAIINMHLQAMSCLAKTYVELGAYTYAHSWARHVWRSRLRSDWLDRTELAHVYHWGALASEGLGRYERAINEMEKACSLDPNDRKLEAELQRLKDQNMEGAMVALGSLHLGLCWGGENASEKVDKFLMNNAKEGAKSA